MLCNCQLAGEILDIRTDAHTQVFLKHHRDSFRKIDFSDTPPVARKVFGSMRRSRQTPDVNPHHPGEKGEGRGRLLQRFCLVACNCLEHLNPIMVWHIFGVY